MKGLLELLSKIDFDRFSKPGLMSDRLNPKNEGNARLLYIDGDLQACDICDEKNEAAVLDTIGKQHSTTLRICKPCLIEILSRFESH